jgi:hypothetical protein
MSILDFNELREARRRAEWERWHAAQDRELAKINRILEQLTPIFDHLMAQKEVRVRGPRCETPGCWRAMTALHPVQGRTSDDVPALIALCDKHLGDVRSGRFRVKLEEGDRLLWQLFDRPGGKLRWEIRRRRRKPSRREHGDRR